jgi:alcohol dehydrogenase (cytochrome c)
MKRILLGLTLLATQLYGAVSYRDIAKTPAGDWLSYSGDYSGQRFSNLSQVDVDNVGRLVPQWLFHVPGSNRLETTPVVEAGVMYVTNSNEVFALDATSGRLIWHYKLPGASRAIPNRGVALLGDSVYFVSGDATLTALDRRTGALLWCVRFAGPSKNYAATLAPLAIPNEVIVGVSGGDCGIRGYIDAYDAETGKHLWRFWTVPRAGEAGAETWGGHPPNFAGGATWMTGTYEVQENVLYWTTGNPGPVFYGNQRPGDNLYTDSVIALDANTGKRKWSFQFTPHDTHDWDAEELPVLIDGAFEGNTRKLLAQANRNGFFYLLDRRDGQMLLAKPFVKKLNWAKGVFPDGRPDLISGMDPTPGGKLVCPGNVGATNWFSPSYSPQTGFLYAMTIEGCDVYVSSAPAPAKGGCHTGTGVEHPLPNTAQLFLRAIAIADGSIRWEIPITTALGYRDSMPGTLATAGGLVFFGDESGYIAAANGSDGSLLWDFYTGQTITASPMTYAVAGKQYLTIASGTNVLTFALFEPSAPLRQPVTSSGEARSK